MFIDESGYTDDSVMTIAVADGLMKAGLDADADTIRKTVVGSLKEWGRKYMNAGYGQRFIWWLMLEDDQPYGSWGNGSAMRVSSAGWLYDSLERTREVARQRSILLQSAENMCRALQRSVWKPLIPILSIYP